MNSPCRVGTSQRICHEEHILPILYVVAHLFGNIKVVYKMGRKSHLLKKLVNPFCIEHRIL